MINSSEFKEFVGQIYVSFNAVDVPPSEISDSLEKNKASIKHAYSIENPNAEKAEIDAWYDLNVIETWPYPDMPFNPNLFDTVRKIFVDIEVLNPTLTQFSSVYNDIGSYAVDAIQDATSAS